MKTGTIHFDDKEVAIEAIRGRLMANYQFSLTQVMQATNAILKKLTSASVFGGVTTDTRKIEEGMLFIALKGENFDGHDFIADAAKKEQLGLL